jgi:hypothetical protein
MFLLLSDTTFVFVDSNIFLFLSTHTILVGVDSHHTFGCGPTPHFWLWNHTAIFCCQPTPHFLLNFFVVDPHCIFSYWLSTHNAFFIVFFVCQPTPHFLLRTHSTFFVVNPNQLTHTTLCCCQPTQHFAVVNPHHIFAFDPPHVLLSTHTACFVVNLHHIICCGSTLHFSLYSHTTFLFCTHGFCSVPTAHFVLFR